MGRIGRVANMRASGGVSSASPKFPINHRREPRREGPGLPVGHEPVVTPEHKGDQVDHDESEDETSGQSVLRAPLRRGRAVD